MVPSWTPRPSSSTASARDLPNTQLDEAKWWTSIETPDKFTVIFRSDKPRPLAFDITNPRAMTTRFEGGTLDAAINFPVTDFLRLRDQPGELYAWLA